MTISFPLRVKIFADGADLATISTLAADPTISGFTTNPTLMRQAGVDNYEAFARSVLEIIGDRPVSFEVFSDEIPEMGEQARVIATWGTNVFVKVPVTTTSGESCAGLVHALASDGVHVNVTAVFTEQQIDDILEQLCPGVPANVSVFAGRIADAGTDPIDRIGYAVAAAGTCDATEIIWASPREVLNIIQADIAGCQIITVTPELLKKMSGLGKDLTQFSLETVQMFRRDALAAGYRL